MPEEDWVKAAITNDSMVAELLLGLNQPNPSPSSLPSRLKKTGSPLEWTVRQPRSRPVSVNAKKAAPRASPTTPLSWSGATSVSCGGGGGSGGAVDGGCEESSGSLHPPSKTPSSTRSKQILLDTQVNGTSDATTSKRSRKKKTLAELKMEEMLLIKERKQLKKELALLRANLEQQRDMNQKLKRRKVDLHPQEAHESGATVAYDGTLGQDQQEVLPSYPTIPIEKVENNVAALPSPLEEQQDVAALESKFVLPDLNIPFGEDSSNEILCGVN